MRADYCWASGQNLRPTCIAGKNVTFLGLSEPGVEEICTPAAAAACRASDASTRKKGEDELQSCPLKEVVVEVDVLGGL